MNLIEKLNKLNACLCGVEYVAGKSAIDAWNNCDRGDWMLWVAQKQGVDLKILTLAKVRCARLVDHLMKDDRSIAALIAAERFANGEITREQLGAAADAADAAAGAAAGAAYYAAAVFAAYYAATDAAAASAYAADAADAAYDSAAYAYDSAAYAAADAARESTLKKCADICRETINFDLLGL